jgi:MerR family transcriptional regulator, light-induced transcriptional regulator
VHDAPDALDPLPGDAVALWRTTLAQAVHALDEEAAEQLLDCCLLDMGVEDGLREVVMPLMRSVGDDWAAGALTVAQEHFATQVVRARLTSLSRGWSRGSGPVAWLACPPAELHDLPLFPFGIALHRGGWRIRFFGAHTPVHDLIGLAKVSPPDLVVLASTTARGLTARRWELTHLARLAPVAVAGEGASWPFADAIGGEYLSGDPVTAAEAYAVRNRHTLSESEAS